MEQHTYDVASFGLLLDLEAHSTTPDSVNFPFFSFLMMLPSLCRGSMQNHGLLSTHVLAISLLQASGLHHKDSSAFGAWLCR